MNGEYWVPIRVAIRPLHTISNHFKLCQSLHILPCIQVDKYYLCDKLFKKCFCRIFLAQGTLVNCDLFNTIYCNIINVFISNIFMAYFKTPKYSFFERRVFEPYIAICLPFRGRHYYWNTNTDEVAWLPPGHPRSKSSLPADKLRGAFSLTSCLLL